MAREVITTYKITDDFSDQAIEETEAEFIGFSIGNVHYEFEVGAATRTKFKTALKAFITKGDADMDPDTGKGKFRQVIERRTPGAPAARTAAASKPSMSAVQLAGKVSGMTWSITKQAWNAVEGEAVPEKTAGMKAFITDMGLDAGGSRIANDVYAEAVDVAIQRSHIVEADA